MFAPPPPTQAAVEDFTADHRIGVEQICARAATTQACSNYRARRGGRTSRDGTDRCGVTLEALRNNQCMKNTVNAMYGRELFTVEAMNVLSIIAGRDLSRETLESQTWQDLKLPHGTFGLNRDWAARLMEVLFPNRAGVADSHFVEVTSEDQKLRLRHHKQSWFKYYHRNTGEGTPDEGRDAHEPVRVCAAERSRMGAAPHFTAVRMRPRAPSSSDPILWDLWNGQHTEADRARMGELGMTDAMLAQELNENLASGLYTIWSLRSTHKPSEEDLRERQLQSIIMSISANHGGEYSKDGFEDVPRPQPRVSAPARPRGQGHRSQGAKRHRGTRR